MSACQTILEMSTESCAWNWRYILIWTFSSKIFTNIGVVVKHLWDTRYQRPFDGSIDLHLMKRFYAVTRVIIMTSASVSDRISHEDGMADTWDIHIHIDSSSPTTVIIVVVVIIIVVVVVILGWWWSLRRGWGLGRRRCLGGGRGSCGRGWWWGRSYIRGWRRWLRDNRELNSDEAAWCALSIMICVIRVVIINPSCKCKKALISKTPRLLEPETTGWWRSGLAKHLKSLWSLQRENFARPGQKSRCNADLAMQKQDHQALLRLQWRWKPDLKAGLVQTHLA